MDEWSDNKYCAGLFDGTTPEYDTVTMGRYDTDELPIQDIKDDCEDWCFLYSD